MWTDRLVFRSLLGSVAFAMFVLALTSVAAFADEQKRTITVAGTGSVSAPPDLASINAGVRTQGKTAQEALGQNTAAMEAIFNGMAGLQIAKKDMQTSNFQVRPLYEYKNSATGSARKTSKIVGYEVSNNVVVVVRDLGRLGEMLDLFVSLGANELNGIQFSFDDASALLDEARVRATKDAMKTAKLIAETSGSQLGKVISASELSHFSPRQKLAQSPGLEFASADVPIAAGEHTITSSVSMVFELE